MKVDICFISDQKFLRYAKTMVNSLVQNNANHEIHLYLVSDDVTQEEADIAFATILTGRQTLTVTHVSKEDIGNIGSNTRFGHYVFYRILLYKFLPAEISTILCLDVDIVVNGDLSALFETQLDGYALGACIDGRPTCAAAFSKQQRERYDLPPEQPYYNAGVILMNLEKMRAEDKGGQMLQAALQDSSLHFLEQDLFNIFYKDEIFHLPNRFNHAPFKDAISNEPGIEPVIIHYFGDRKPDSFRYYGEYVNLYWKYEVERPSKLWMIKYRVMRCVYLLVRPCWMIPLTLYYAIKAKAFPHQRRKEE